MPASGLAERTAAPGAAGATRRRPAAGVLRALRARAGLIFGAVVFALALYALHHLLAQFQYREVMAHLGSLSWMSIAGALALTALSYLTLAGYDLSALHYVGARLPIRTVLYASFTGYAISNNLGFALLSGGSVRYRVYSAAGLPGGDVARVIVFCSVTFTLGICAVGAVGFLLQPDAVARLLYLPPLAAQAIAGLLVVALLGALVLPMLMPGGLRLGRWRLNLPSPGLVIVQMLISSVDILLTAGILFILLPPHDFGFGAFIGIYCAALLAGLISHVPGGVGVFESIMLLGLAGAVPGSGVLGALLAYRAAYYLLPMVVATLLLAGGELAEHRGRALRAFGLVGRVADRVAPTAMAMLVFAVGVVLLVSGAVPADYTRLLALNRAVPLPVIEAAHLLGSLAGLALLLLARGLHRRIAAAWTFTVLVLASGIVLSLCRGLDYGAVAMLGLVLAMLLPCRAVFGRPSSLTELRFSRGWLLVVIGAVLASVWLTLFSYKHVEYADDLWWRFALSADAPRSLRAALLMVVAVAGVALAQLLRPAAPRPLTPTPAELDRAAAIVARSGRVDGNLALLGDKALLFSAAGDGFLMYGTQDTSWIALSDPVAERPVQAELIWQFCELCDRNGARPAFYRVRAETLPLYLDVGLLPIALAEQAVVPLAGFTPGPALRAAERDAAADGLEVEIVPAAATAPLMAALAAVSDDWLRSRGGVEKGYAFGRFDPAYLARFDIVAVRRRGQIIAFANVWQAAPGTAAGLDLMRHRADAPDYVDDLLLSRLLSRASDRGDRHFDLGVMPRTAPAAPAAVWGLAGASLADARGDCRAPLDPQRIRDRVAPAWEARYLVSAGGLAPARVLADVAALVGAAGTSSDTPGEG